MNAIDYLLASYHLLRHHDHRLCRKSSIAVVEKVFQRRSQEIDDEYVMEAFLAKVVDVRYASLTILASLHPLNAGQNLRQPTRIL